MKKMIEKRNSRLKLIGLVLLCVIGIVLLFMSPLSAGVITAMLAIPAGIDLTDKEKAAMQAVVDAVNKEVEKLSKGYITEEKFSELATSAIKEYLKDNDPSKARILELENALKAQGLEIMSLKENRRESIKSFSRSVADTYVKNLESIKQLRDNRTGMLSFEIKEVSPMTTGTHVTGESGLMETLEAGVTRIVRRVPFLRDIMNTANTTSPIIKYVEYTSPSGDAAATGEGVKKSQVDFKLVVRSAEAKKITAFIKVAEEMIADIPFIRGEIDNDLMERLDLEVDAALLSGDGVDENLKGVLTYAPAFSAGIFANTVERANKFDVLRTAVAIIFNNNFIPNYIVLNPLDSASIELTKGEDGHYVLPPFIASNGKIIGSVPIIENSGVTAGSFLVGDFMKANLRIRQDSILRVGYENDDFIKNFMTILVETRMAHYIKNNHLNAFIKGDFATAIAAIAAEESVS